MRRDKGSCYFFFLITSISVRHWRYYDFYDLEKLELIDKLLQNILENLPLIAEEGEYKDKISRDDLCRILEERTPVSHSVIMAVIEMVELQWTKAGLLDSFELKLGNWQFLSFSSSLAARSWLEVMSDKDSYWFSGGWWADHANSENQRKLLKKI